MFLTGYNIFDIILVFENDLRFLVTFSLYDELTHSPHTRTLK